LTKTEWKIQEGRRICQGTRAQLARTCPRCGTVDKGVNHSYLKYHMFMRSVAASFTPYDIIPDPVAVVGMTGRCKNCRHRWIVI